MSLLIPVRLKMMWMRVPWRSPQARPGSPGGAEGAEGAAGAAGAPGVIDRSCWRSACASGSRRATRRPPEESAPAIRSRISASPNTRASPVWTTSIAWTWESGKRRDCRRISPVSMSSTPPSTRQRVTAQLITPATMTIATTTRSLMKSLPACRALTKISTASRMTKLVR